MAGTGIKYYTQFKDSGGQQYTINFIQAGYEGAQTECVAGPVPVVISLMHEGTDKYTVLKPTEAIIQLVSDTNFKYLELFTGTARSFSVSVVRGSDTIWQGWVDPDYYQEPFAAPPYIISIRAVDGLAQLKDTKFAPIVKTTYRYSLITWIADALARTGLSLSIEVATGLIADMNDGTDITGRIMESVYADYRAFRDGEDMGNCAFILTALLAPFHCRVYQNPANARWRVERIDEKYESGTVEIYNSSGVYQSASSVDPIETMTSSAVAVGSLIRLANADTMLEIEGAWKEFTVDHQYGQRTQILNMYNWEGKFYDDEWSSGTELINWTRNGYPPLANITIEQYSDEQREDAVLVQPMINGTIAAQYLLQTLTFSETTLNDRMFTAWSGNRHILKLDFDYFVKYTGSHKLVDADTFTVRVKLILEGGDTATKVYSSNITVIGSENRESDSVVTWKTTDNANAYIKFTDVEPNKWNSASLYIAAPKQGDFDWEAEDSVYLTMQLCAGESSFSDSATLEDGVAYTNVRLYWSKATIDRKRMKEYYKRKGGFLGWIYSQFNSVPLLGFWLGTYGVSRYTITTVSDEDDEFSEQYDFSVNSENRHVPDDIVIHYGSNPNEWGIGKLEYSGMKWMHRFVYYDSDGKEMRYFGLSNGFDKASLIGGLFQTKYTLSYRTPRFKLIGTLLDRTRGVSFASSIKDYNSRVYIPLDMEYDIKNMTMSGTWLQIFDPNDPNELGEYNNDFSQDFWI